MYLINCVSTEILTTGRVMPPGTNLLSTKKNDCFIFRLFFCKVIIKLKIYYLCFYDYVTNKNNTYVQTVRTTPEK